MPLVVVLLISDLVSSYTTSTHAYYFRPRPACKRCTFKDSKTLYFDSEILLSFVFRRFQQSWADFTNGMNEGFRAHPCQQQRWEAKTGRPAQVASEIGNLSWILAVWLQNKFHQFMKKWEYKCRHVRFISRSKVVLLFNCAIGDTEGENRGNKEL